MSRIRFSTVREDLYSPELGPYRSYGIIACAKRFFRWRKVAHVSDVSLNEPFVYQLADTCTHLQLDPCHLFDVVIDAIP